MDISHWYSVYLTSGKNSVVITNVTFFQRDQTTLSFLEEDKKKMNIFCANWNKLQSDKSY